MIGNVWRLVAMAGIAAALAADARAAQLFSESFASGTANWRFNTANNPALTAVASGGADGGAYISHTFATLPTGSSSLVFRAHKLFNSSNVAYAGNWITLGVNEVSAWVRHNAPEPLVFNSRFVSEANFPGASYYSDLVPPNAWTKVTFNVAPNSPQLADPTFEGTNSYAGVFSDIGNMQFGINIPTALRGAGPFTFDFDNVAVQAVPEPVDAALTLLAAMGFAGVRRRIA